MKKNIFKRFSAIFLVFAMLLGVMPVVSFAQESVNDVEYFSNFNLNKTATGLDDKDQTDVTLSVPGEFTSLGVDIIYVAGAYLEKNQVESDLMIESLYSTFTELVGAGVPVNFGFVPFSYDDKAVMELTSYKTSEDLESFHGDLRDAISAASGAYGGENMENALQVAKNMFAASPLADHPDRQHLVLVASGHTYNFNVGENNDIFSTVPVAIKGSEKADKYFFGFKAWMQARNKNPNNYPIPKPFSTYNDYRDWDAYWAVIDEWATADKAAGDKVVYNILDTTDYSFGYNDWYTTKYLGQDSTHDGVNTFKSFGAYIHTATQLALDNGYDFANAPISDHGSLIGTTIDNVPAAARHAISYERAMWEASNFIDEEITGAGINFYPIYNQMQPYYTNGVLTNNQPNPDGKRYNHNVTWTQQYIGHSFMNMLARNAGQGLEAVNNSTATDKAFFDPIKEKILYTCSVGSTVVDYIGKNENGNFEFIENADYLKLVVGGVKYTVAEVETAKHIDKDGEEARSSYAFTAPGSTVPTFWLDYYYGNGKTTERFVWTFGENVSIKNKATLTYKLQLIEKQEESGTYTVPTNNSAHLYPVDSDGNEYPPQPFPIPEVEYTVESKIDIKGKKNWEDADNQDGKRPESITINLLADGTVIDTKTVTADNDWTWSFEGLDKRKDGKEIVYTITENSVNGYETVVDGFNVTNTHSPEKIDVSGEKTWNDDNNRDGIRPESITVNLLANGTVVDTKTVTAYNNWAWSFDGLYKYVNGKEIVYTITESPVSGYETVVDGYNVTNTHSPEKIDISGEKNWDDDNNRDGIRPGSITINLLANGTVVDTKTVTAADDWAWTFEGFYKYENGREIVYTITESPVSGYETVVDGYNVTNVHSPEKIDVSGVKTWDDDNNRDGIRPESITVNLLADGTVVNTRPLLKEITGLGHLTISTNTRTAKKLYTPLPKTLLTVIRLSLTVTT